jgi:hypothetical protein
MRYAAASRNNMTTKAKWQEEPDTGESERAEREPYDVDCAGRTVDSGATSTDKLRTVLIEDVRYNLVATASGLINIWIIIHFLANKVDVAASAQAASVDPRNGHFQAVMIVPVYVLIVENMTPGVRFFRQTRPPSCVPRVGYVSRPLGPAANRANQAQARWCH